MRLTHYLYNAFLIDSGDKRIAIDPGGLFCYWFRFTSLIPESEWESITHILVTHGDPDHHWHTDRVAKASGAPVVCNRTMLREVGGDLLMLGPRDKGLSFTTSLANITGLAVGECIDMDGISITGVKTSHGELLLRLGPLSKSIKPGPDERIGWGAIGFDIQVDGKRLVNLGDTLLHEREWQAIGEPDVLMIPIGGAVSHNTMDIPEAVRAVRVMRPKLVIPCHYNFPALFNRHYNPADANLFKTEVEKSGAECVILRKGESVSLNAEG